MTKNDRDNFKTGNDLNTLGFATNLAKQGIIKLMFGILITLVLLEFGVIIWQQRSMNENSKVQSDAHEKQAQFLLELLKGYENTKQFVDTSIRKQY